MYVYMRDDEGLVDDLGYDLNAYELFKLGMRPIDIFAVLRLKRYDSYYTLRDNRRVFISSMRVVIEMLIGDVPLRWTLNDDYFYDVDTDLIYEFKCIPYTNKWCYLQFDSMGGL